MGDTDDETANERVRRERDLYRRLLDLGTHDEIEPFLREALELIVDTMGARLGYLEIADGTDDAGPRFSIAHGLSNQELASIRSLVSSGIIAEALATGEIVVTPSAILDPRFGGRESVHARRIEAVLCAPIGVDPPRGVLYLQGRSGAGPFSPSDRTPVELFARHVVPLADRLLTRRRHHEDPTAEFRPRLRADGLVGRSQALANLLRQISLVAPLEVDVLLTGDSGTGKSLVARVIHDSSPRARAAFVELNCAALPESLIESELFGALAGAHSTATRRMDGKVAAAEGGTLFLDEIGELAIPAQAKLLHLIHAKQYYPLGATKAQSANVRIVAATNVDLKAAVAEKRFREDLLYRLQVLPIRVPSLAERPDDVPELARYFCGAACQRHGLPRTELSRSALRAAQSAEWPGNVRQLAHAMEAAVIRAAGEGSSFVERSHLFPDAGEDHSPQDGEVSFQERTRRFQSSLLRELLDDEDWNVGKVADRLDLARSHVYALIRGFGLKRRAG
ncbi:MAG TPA: sigma-54-dependent Fis family transcriptional regulator [Candidatus Binatia bacterium]|nr:sigma-54-dependent Fis family transcriptional regulator [Candidatus Binatia bacterium]